MKKFEYRTVILRNSIFKSSDDDATNLQIKCNAMGKDGWELVNFQNYDLALKCMLIFKREVE